MRLVQTRLRGSPVRRLPPAPGRWGSAGRRPAPAPSPGWSGPPRRAGYRRWRCTVGSAAEGHRASPMLVVGGRTEAGTREGVRGREVSVPGHGLRVQSMAHRDLGLGAFDEGHGPTAPSRGWRGHVPARSAGCRVPSQRGVPAVGSGWATASGAGPGRTYTPRPGSPRAPRRPRRGSRAVHRPPRPRSPAVPLADDPLFPARVLMHVKNLPAAHGRSGDGLTGAATRAQRRLASARHLDDLQGHATSPPVRPRVKPRGWQPSHRTARWSC